MPIVLEEATADDVEDVVRLVDRVWRRSYADLLPAPLLLPADVQGRAAELLEVMTAVDPLRRAVLARSADGGIVGWALVGSSRAELAGVPRVRTHELRQLYVEATGLGLGASLLARVLPDRGPAELWVFDDNVAAQRFYRRHGFEPDGTTHRYRPDVGGGVAESRMVR